VERETPTPSRESHFSPDSLGAAFWRKVKLNPDKALYRYALASSAEATRIWRTESYSEAAQKIAKIAHFLIKSGVTLGTPVAIVSNTRLEWMLVDMAVQTLGGITVSVYHSLTAVETGFILADSGASIVFIENEEQAQKIAWLSSNPCPIPERETLPQSEVQLAFSKIVSFEGIESIKEVEILSSILTQRSLPTIPPALPEELSQESIASYVYTSGTTGPPKGVIQTHGNHLANIEQAELSGVFSESGSLFLYLPLAHSFARLIYYVGFISSPTLVLPAVIDHQTSKLDLSSIARDIREAGAHVIPSVPRLFEKMASAIKTRSKGSSISARILAICLKNATQVQVHRERGLAIGLTQQIFYQALRGVRSKIKEQLFGKEFTHAISGGARLDPEVTRFFDALGIVICEGYGLTETCVATHVNLPDRRKIGSVGPAFERVEVQISPQDGEIWLKGPNVTQGYLNRPLATIDAWTEDGWFKTGDVGRIDEDSFLFITDRKKELVVTAGGKKIAPTAIEGHFKRFPFISQAFLYGEGRPYCVLLLTLNELELKAELKASGYTPKAGADYANDPNVAKLIQSAVTSVNKTLASFEQIKNHAVLDEDFTIENGLLTPTLKMKRRVITERYRDVLDKLYWWGG
jgi:long-chain acyl-CoA synthetase